MTLNQVDPEIYKTINKEKKRQSSNINLIASENYASAAVLEAQGSVFSNKYAEGYPGNRYYGGCEYVDIAENLAIERAKTLFDSDYANVQPHSGAQANMAAYFACVSPGDTILGMGLEHGGHLTHGSKVNFSAKLYNFISYGVDKDTELIDFDLVNKLAFEHKPKLIVAGASAYSRTIQFEKFRHIADSIGAKLMVDMAHISGLVAAGIHPNPCEFADITTSTTHKTLRGPRGGLILAKKELAKKINSAVFPNMQGGPMGHTIAAKAVAFQEAQSDSFGEYQKAVVKNANTLANTLKKGGLRLVSGGTDNHMCLIDLTPMNISGKQAEEALGRANIVVNRNAIPFDRLPPRQASGLRLGTPSITTRGIEHESAVNIGEYILQILQNIGDPKVEKEVQEKVLALCTQYPIPEMFG